MKRLAFLRRKAIRWRRDMPELQLLMPGFGLSLGWEVLQSPFYTDTFEVPWSALLYNRLHCAGGDALLLLLSFWLVALGWGRHWMYATRGGTPFVVFLGLGFVYTVCSEHFNVHLVQRWAYNQWMPTVGGIGLMPLLQWVVVPTLSVWLVRRRARQQR